MQSSSQRAKQLFDEGRVKLALRLYEEVLQADPNDLGARRGLAHCHIALRNYDGAEHELQHGLGLSPDDPKLHASLAYVCILRKQFDRAESEIARAMALGPELAAPHAVQGELQFERRAWQQAKQSFEQAVVLDDDDLFSRWRLYAIHNQLGERDQAARQAKVVMLKSRSPWLRVWAATAFALLTLWFWRFALLGGFVGLLALTFTGPIGAALTFLLITGFSVYVVRSSLTLGRKTEAAVLVVAYLLIASAYGAGFGLWFLGTQPRAPSTPPTWPTLVIPQSTVVSDKTQARFIIHNTYLISESVTVISLATPHLRPATQQTVVVDMSVVNGSQVELRVECNLLVDGREVSLFGFPDYISDDEDLQDFQMPSGGIRQGKLEIPRFETYATATPVQLSCEVWEVVENGRMYRPLDVVFIPLR